MLRNVFWWFDGVIVAATPLPASNVHWFCPSTDATLSAIYFALALVRICFFGLIRTSLMRIDRLAREVRGLVLKVALVTRARPVSRSFWKSGLCNKIDWNRVPGTVFVIFQSARLDADITKCSICIRRMFIVCACCKLWCVIVSRHNETRLLTKTSSFGLNAVNLQTRHP